MQLLLDINSDIYPVDLGDQLTVALAKSLGSDDDMGYDQGSGRESLAKDYEYVMYGKVFKCLEDKSSKVYTCPSSFACREQISDGDFNYYWLCAGLFLFRLAVC